MFDGLRAVVLLLSGCAAVNFGRPLSVVPAFAAGVGLSDAVVGAGAGSGVGAGVGVGVAAASGAGGVASVAVLSAGAGAGVASLVGPGVALSVPVAGAAGAGATLGTADGTSARLSPLAAVTPDGGGALAFVIGGGAGSDEAPEPGCIAVMSSVVRSWPPRIDCGSTALVFVTLVGMFEPPFAGGGGAWTVKALRRFPASVSPASAAFCSHVFAWSRSRGTPLPLA